MPSQNHGGIGISVIILNVKTVESCGGMKMGKKKLRNTKKLDVDEIIRLIQFYRKWNKNFESALTFTVLYQLGEL